MKGQLMVYVLLFSGMVLVCVAGLLTWQAEHAPPIAPPPDEALKKMYTDLYTSVNALKDQQLNDPRFIQMGNSLSTIEETKTIIDHRIHHLEQRLQHLEKQVTADIVVLKNGQSYIRKSILGKPREVIVKNEAPIDVSVVKPAATPPLLKRAGIKPQETGK